MKIRLSELKQIIREAILAEIDIEDVTDLCYTSGSTHVMRTCKIGGNKYFLKFSNEDLFRDFDPSLQILIEYLAYKVYSLYSGVRVPDFQLVYDAENKAVGLATSPAAGKSVSVYDMDPKFLAKMLSQGVYVDIFLANWDVVAPGNVFVSKDKATRIDPGGSMTFRARGGRKPAFGPKVGEFETMLKRGTDSGNVYSHADLKLAAKEFMSVRWKDISQMIDEVKKEISDELKSKGMPRLLQQWVDDVDLIKGILKQRHQEVVDHAIIHLE